MDTCVARAMLDSLIELDEQRFFRGIDEDYIKELHKDLNQAQTIIEGKTQVISGYKKLDSIQEVRTTILKDNVATLKKQIKKHKFQSRLFGSLGIIGAGLGGYLIGKK